MRITKLKKISIIATICAIAMIFAHMIIPHSHNSCHSKDDSCCTISSSFSQGEQIPEGHLHCIISNTVFQQDTNYELNSILLILAVEHWGYVYSPSDLPLILNLDYNHKFTEDVALKLFVRRLPSRAPPTFA